MRSGVVFIGFGLLLGAFLGTWEHSSSSSLGGNRLQFLETDQASSGPTHFLEGRPDGGSLFFLSKAYSNLHELYSWPQEHD